MEKEISLNEFASLGIKEPILSSLKRLKIEKPSPIQMQVIKPAIKGHDIIGIAQTGTGKTFAFALPIIQKILESKDCKVLILTPTRELAIQLAESFRSVSLSSRFKIATLIGGQPIDRQIFSLKKRPEIVVATPGRLMDHMRRGTYRMDGLKVLVLDEADMMLDLGFYEQIKDILDKSPKEKQTMLFSATMPPTISKLAAENLKLPIRVEIAPQGTTAEKVEQEIFVVRPEDRFTYLEKIVNKYNGSILIFVRTKNGARDLNKKLKSLNHSSVEIHSDLSLARRRSSLDDFKSGKARILVATDVAARGLDINGIELVINFNLPESSSDYVHRIGRTGRAGKVGRAISLATPNQFKDVALIEKLINKNIPRKEYAQFERGGFSRKSGSRRFKAASKSANRVNEFFKNKKRNRK